MPDDPPVTILPAGIAIRFLIIVSAGCVKDTSVLVSSVTAIVAVVTEVIEVRIFSAISRTSTVFAELRPVSRTLYTGFAMIISSIEL